jgi:hypothetical protein
MASVIPSTARPAWTVRVLQGMLCLAFLVALAEVSARACFPAPGQASLRGASRIEDSAPADQGPLTRSPAQDPSQQPLCLASIFSPGALLSLFDPLGTSMQREEEQPIPCPVPDWARCVDELATADVISADVDVLPLEVPKRL